jgi:ankyrin repeat protein
MFRACFFGYLKEVEVLYWTSPWYARDVRDLDGTNPIFWALRQQHVEVAKFLISVNAGVDNEKDDGQCAKGYFAAQTIANYSEPGVFDTEIYQLLRLREYINEMGLPEITRSILGLPRSRPLQHLIEDFPSRSSNEARMEDELGKTALHWACQQGNDQAVSQLLKLGANMNASTPNGSTPLHGAAASKRPSECINILFQTGVVISRDIYGNTPLHVACQSGIVETVESLLDNGMSMEDLNQTGQTPLLVATEYNRVSILTLLLDRGADITAADVDGDTSFHWGVWQNAHECVRELLGRGVKTGVVDCVGTNIFHVAAAQGDEEMLDIIAEDGLPGLDVNAKDHSGRTAQQIFQSRAGVTSRLRSAFEQLRGRMSVLSTR